MALKPRLSELISQSSLTRTLRSDTLTPSLASQPSSSQTYLPANPVPLHNLSSTTPSRTPRLVDAHFSYVIPEPTIRNDDPSDDIKIAETFLIAVSERCGEEIGLDLHRILSEDETERNRFVNVVSGNEVLAGTDPWSLNYGGFQFGSWAGQLGDGRAISLFQTATNFEVQLKGAGMTPYSRFADGYAVLRSSIREFLASESMHALGVPTSRSMTLVAAPGRKIQREQIEGAAIISRITKVGGWIRFGSFDLLTKRGKYDMLKELADFTVREGFPEVWEQYHADIGQMYSAWFEQVVKKTAVLIAHWQAIGFAHGVMNTDNFSILGITIDYGPYQFLDHYDPGYICNHSDHDGRYSFDAQPSIGFWNLNRLASAISPLIVRHACGGDQEAALKILHEKLDLYQPTLTAKYSELMHKKIGLTEVRPNDLEEIIQPMLNALAEANWDYTNYFRKLSDFKLVENKTEVLTIPDNLPDTDNFHVWYSKYKARLLSELNTDDLQLADDERKMRMNKTNPRYVPRNYILQKVIEETEKFVEDLDSKYKHSSSPGNDLRMKPVVALKNSVSDYLKVIQNPFEDGTIEEQHRFGTEFSKGVPLEFKGLKCSCSS